MKHRGFKSIPKGRNREVNTLRSRSSLGEPHQDGTGHVTSFSSAEGNTENVRAGTSEFRPWVTGHAYPGSVTHFSK